MSKRHPRISGVKGYRLHAQRLEYTGKSGAMRTIKYPLYSSPSGGRTVPREIVSAINDDYVGLYGLSNFDDLYNAEKRNEEKVYSVLDFWYDCVQYGAVFSYTAPGLLKNVAEVRGGSYELTKTLKGSHLYDELQIDKVIKFLNKKEISRANGSLDKLKKDIIDCFKAEYRERHKDQCNKLADDIKNAKKDAGASLGERQKKLFRDFFGISEQSENDKPSFTNPLNLTCCLLPFDTVNNNRNRGEVLFNKLKEYAQKLDKNEGSLEMWEYIGIGNSGTAFSNFLGEGFLGRLRENKITELKKAMMDITDAWRGQEQEEELEKRLRILAALTIKLREPKFDNHWGGYRSDINGKLSSWLQNYINQTVKIKEDLKGHKKDLKKAKEMINRFGESDTKEEAVVSSLLESIEKIVPDDSADDEKPDIPAIAIYRRFLSDGRLTLNRFVQREDVQEALIKERLEAEKKKKPKKRKKKSDAEDEKETIDFKELFPHLAKPLKLVPNFYGDSKRELYKKYKNAAIYTDALWKAVEKIYKSAFSSSLKNSFFDTDFDKDFFIKRLQKIFSVYRRFNTDKWKPIVKNSFAPYCDIVSLAENEVLYKPKQSRSRKSAAIDKNRVRLPSTENIAKAGIALARELSVAGFDWKDLLKKEEHEEYIDLIELHKTALALLLAVTETQLDISALDFVENGTVKDFMKTRDGNLVLEGRFLEMFSQSIVFSELRGLAGLMSRKEFITRSAIQTMNGKQAELLYIPHEFQSAKITTPKEMSRAFLDLAPAEFATSLEPESLSEKSLLKLKQMRYYPHYFGYELTRTGQGIDGGVAENALRLEKSPVKKREIKCKQYKTLGRGQNKIVLYVRSSYYQTQFLEWFLHRPKNVQTDVAVSGSFLIDEKKVKTRWNYDALTVALEPVSGSERVFVSQPFTIFPEKSAEEEGQRYLGIDIGEYGIAYTALEITGDSAKILDQNFISDPQLKTLREEVKGLKLDQRRGTFAMPSTKIARIRESLVHSLRNRIHHLALKHKAKIVYELEVSRFEEGKQKIKKVYATLKKADVYSEIDADKNLQTTVWGKLAVASEISASYTSQFCGACKKLWRAEMQVDETITTQELIGTVRVIKGGTLIDAIKDFMRPPIFDENDTPFPKYRDFCDKHHISKKMRGNSCLFICPFCRANADADIQASQTIALLRYVKEEKKVEDYFERFRKLKNIKVLGQMKKI